MRTSRNIGRKFIYLERTNFTWFNLLITIWIMKRTCTLKVSLEFILFLEKSFLDSYLKVIANETDV